MSAVPTCPTCHRPTNENRICVDCGAPFVLLGDEAAWYMREKLSLPHRCKPCRDKRRSERAARHGRGAAEAGDEHEKGG